MGLATDPAGRHRAVAGHFTERIEAVREGDDPSPVAESTARGVVRHLVDWFPAFLATGSAYRLDPPA